MTRLPEINLLIVSYSGKLRKFEFKIFFYDFPFLVYNAEICTVPVCAIISYHVITQYAFEFSADFFYRFA